MSNYELRIHPPPVFGVDKRTEGVLLNPLYSPNMKNIIVSPSKVKKRLGDTQVGSNLPLLGTGMELTQFVDGAATKHHLAITSRFIYEYNSDSDEWEIRNDGIQLHDCEANWDNNGDADVTVSFNTSFFKQGSKSVKMVISGGDGVADDGLLAVTSDISPVLDLTDANSDRSVDLNSIHFWIRSVNALASGDISLIISEGSDAAVGGGAGTFVVIALDLVVPADTWTLVEVSTTQTTLNAVKSLGLQNTSGSTMTAETIYIDDIWARFAFSETSTRWSHTILHDSTASTPGWNNAKAIALSNNVDLPVQWDGNETTFGELVTNISDFNYVKELSSLANHLCLYNFFIGSTLYKRNCRFADIGDTDDFAVGTSGEEVLTDSIGEILRAKPFKKQVAIYSEKSITLQRHVGGNSIFLFDTVIQEVGLLAEKALWNSSLVHYFIGSDQKFYSYPGGSELVSIGRLFEENFFKRVDATNIDKVILGYDEGRHKLYCFYPDKEQGDTTAKQYFAINLTELQPSVEEGRFAHSVRDFSIFSNRVDYTCNGPFFNPPGAAAHTCDEFPDMRCNAAYLQAGYAIAIVISDDGFVYKLDEISGKDDSTNIECILETPDYTIEKGTEEFEGRWSQFGFNTCSQDSVSVSASTVTVEYSVDYGDTWIALPDSPVTLNTAWTEHQLELDVKDRRIRFRFTQNSDGDFQLRGLSTKVKKETIRS